MKFKDNIEGFIEAEKFLLKIGKMSDCFMYEPYDEDLLKYVNKKFIEEKTFKRIILTEKK